MLTEAGAGVLSGLVVETTVTFKPGQPGEAGTVNFSILKVVFFVFVLLLLLLFFFVFF